MKEKTIIIFLLIIHVILCSDVSDCYKESNLSCTSKSIEKKGISCFTFKVDNQDSECYIFPEEKTKQEKAIKIMNVLNLEASNLNEVEEEETEEKKGLKGLSIVNKSGYDKSETIETKFSDITNSDEEILSERSNCGAVSMDLSYEEKDDEEKKQLCFNSKKLKDAENLIECGFGVVNIYLGSGYNSEFSTCFLMPDLSKLSKDDILIYFFKTQLEKLFVHNYSSGFLGFDDSGGEGEGEVEGEVEGEGEGKEEENDDANNYIFIVNLEDRYGNKIKMTGNSDYIDISMKESKNRKIIYKMNYCLYDKTKSLKILEKKENKYIFYDMESNDDCLWKAEIEFEKNFEYKFVIVKDKSILRWQLGDFYYLEESNLNVNIDIKGCEGKDENGKISFTCTWKR